MSENSSWQDGEGFGKEANDRLKRLSAIRLTDTYRKIHPQEKVAYTHWHFGKNIRDEGNLPDLFVHGEVPMRLKYKLETMIRHEFEQYGLPMY